MTGSVLAGGIVSRSGGFWRGAALLMALLVGVPHRQAQAEGAAPPALPGTNWQLLSLTGKGEAIKDAMNPADVEFLKDGKWGILHYGGRREAGTYQVTKSHLVMKTEDGAVYMEADMTWKPAEQLLELRDSEYLMRLRVQQKKPK